MTEAVEKKNNIRQKIESILPSQRRYKVLLIAMALLAVLFLAMMAIFKAFPAGMTLAMIVIMFVMLAAAGFLMG